MEKTLLVTVEIEGEDRSWTLEDSALELEELAAAAGAEVVDNITCKREAPSPATFIGKGKAEEVALMCSELGATAVIFSKDLSGTQLRNLEDVIGKRIIDRTMLILHIFARHAKSPEGKMQVELAQLKYLMPRLTKTGTEYSRTGGGIGTSGPGETKLEVDRRRIREKIDRLQGDLKDVVHHRSLMRKRRLEKDVPSIAIVGYTSAGKSTLLNKLTGSHQRESPNLFTTLDPLTRPLELPNGGRVVLSDTVGFIHDLPHNLVEAFKATLEEVVEADLLIHVVDASNRLVDQHIEAVLEVLTELKADDKTILTVLNKSDLLDEETLLRITRQFPEAMPISAKTGLHLDKLIEYLAAQVSHRVATVTLMVPHTKMAFVNQIHSLGEVTATEYLSDGIKITVNIQKTSLANILQDKEITVVS